MFNRRVFFYFHIWQESGWLLFADVELETRHCEPHHEEPVDYGYAAYADSPDDVACKDMVDVES